MKLIDCHAHLEGERYKEDMEEVLKRAEEKGLTAVICSGVNPSTNRAVLKLSKKYPIIKCSFGIYPVDAVADKINLPEEMRHIEKFDVDKELKWIEEHKGDCVAIGEVGLDFKMIKDPKIQKAQEEIFKKIIDLCIKLDKPMVVHSRSAELRAIEILEEKKAKKVMMHCFSGKKNLIRRIAQNGWTCSVPAVITRLQHFKTLTEIMPIEQLVTETDSPYLSPVAMTRNEPVNVKVTITEIAKIKDMDEENVAKELFENAKELFKL
jgi:TatD DNase family protein